MLKIFFIAVIKKTKAALIWGGGRRPNSKSLSSSKCKNSKFKLREITFSSSKCFFLLLVQFRVASRPENSLKECIRNHPNKFTWRLLRSINMYLRKVKPNWVIMLVSSMKQNLICSMSTYGISRKTWNELPRTVSNFVLAHKKLYQLVSPCLRLQCKDEFYYKFI